MLSPSKMKLRTAQPQQMTTLHGNCLPPSEYSAHIQGQGLTEGLGDIIQFLLRTTYEHQGKTSAGEL